MHLIGTSRNRRDDRYCRRTPLMYFGASGGGIDDTGPDLDDEVPAGTQEFRIAPRASDAVGIAFEGAFVVTYGVVGIKQRGGRRTVRMYRSTNQCRHPGCRTTWLHWVSPNLNGLADTGMLIVLCKFTFRSTAAFMFPAAHPTMLVDTDENWACETDHVEIVKKTRKMYFIREK